MKYLEPVAKWKRIRGAMSFTSIPASVNLSRYSTPAAKLKPNSCTMDAPELLNTYPPISMVLKFFSSAVLSVVAFTTLNGFGSQNFPSKTSLLIGSILIPPCIFSGLNPFSATYSLNIFKMATLLQHATKLISIHSKQISFNKVAMSAFVKFLQFVSTNPSESTPLFRTFNAFLFASATSSTTMS